MTTETSLALVMPEERFAKLGPLWPNINNIHDGIHVVQFRETSTAETWVSVFVTSICNEIVGSIDKTVPCFCTVFCIA